MSHMGEVHQFDWSLLTPADLEIAKRYVPGLRAPDLIIDDSKGEGGGKAYLYRWHVIEHTHDANIYFHIQTADDPERPLHDHPWDNQSVILSGSYIELMAIGNGPILRHKRVVGDVVHRIAAQLHRLELPPGIPYAMTQFSTGPKIRHWGFQIGDEWVAYEECAIFVGNRTIFKWPERFRHLEKELSLYDPNVNPRTLNNRR